jgi:hypothetical protein
MKEMELVKQCIQEFEAAKVALPKIIMYARDEDPQLTSSYNDVLKVDHFLKWPLDSAVIKQVLISYELF